MPRRNRKMSGGFLDSLKNSLSSGWSSVSQGASNAYNKTKNAVTGQPSYSIGGKTKKNKRGGSYSAHKSVVGLAAHASPVSNIKTAQPHNMVGGKKSKTSRKHKHSKSCKH